MLDNGCYFYMFVHMEDGAKLDLVVLLPLLIFSPAPQLILLGKC